ncbi:hypothetical protein KW850_04330 [Bacillus sp. sid0103]|uniref:hypothetical protein n=1 Tax=Bacillus sp. sid0103 TaxID=2856337 RepID=UPI001C45C9CA|nr:hypothetical protein [Bacillus sp. sid0103]MBV7504493.1 hypothetical protein [Bacillus sp. sid0103]
MRKTAYYLYLREYHIIKGIPASKKWESGTRVMVRLIDLFKMMKFVHLCFEK